MMLLVVFLALHQYLFFLLFYFILFLNDHIEIYNNWVNLFLLGFVVVYGSTYSLINILLEGINIDFLYWIFIEFILLFHILGVILPLT